MIFLTGDIHHSSLKTKELPYISPLTEMELANEYLTIAEAYDLKVTLFITGKTFVEELDRVEDILKHKNVEIGGHTFNGFKPLWLHRGFKLIKASYWRSYTHQCKEVKKTVEIIRQTIDIKISCWRNHCYDYDKNTIKILEKFGIIVWSDEIKRDCYKPYYVTKNIISLPVNIIQDHNMLYHGYKTEQWFKKQNNYYGRVIKSIKKFVQIPNLSMIGELPHEKLYYNDEWIKLLINDVETKVKMGGVAVLNLHPVCMYLLDKFQTFTKICRFLSQYKSYFASQAKSI